MWVLIVISVVYGGQNISFQEFSTKEKCIAAAEYIQKNSRSSAAFNVGIQATGCIEK